MAAFPYCCLAFYARSSIFWSGLAFSTAKSRVRRVWPGKRERLKGPFCCAISHFLLEENPRYIVTIGGDAFPPSPL